LLAPIRYRALTVLPVARQGKPTAHLDAVTLAEGLARKTVIVSEREGGGDVNHVNVENRADHPLLLLGGEMILGGQQDRIMGKDTLVPPHQRMVVEVFCVEHGRWTGQSNFTAAHGIADNDIRLRAKYKGDQGEVWDKVARKASALGAESETGTYRRVAAGAAGDKAIQPYRDAVTARLRALPEGDQVVGVVAAINGRVTSIDVFATPDLFRAYRDELLDSLFLTVADVSETAEAAKPPSPDTVKRFVDDAERGRSETVASGKGSRTVEKKGERVVGSSVELPAATPAAPAQEPIYKSYQSKE
jgi:hypothetical protein